MGVAAVEATETTGLVFCPPETTVWGGGSGMGVYGWCAGRREAELEPLPGAPAGLRLGRRWLGVSGLHFTASVREVSDSWIIPQGFLEEELLEDRAGLCGVM